MKRPALLVIDMLNDFLERWEADDRAALSRGINEMTGAFRANQRPVIWVRQEFEPDLSDAYPEMRARNLRVTIKGTPGSDIVPELDQGPADHEIVKKRYSAFFSTRLDDLLAQLGVDGLVLAGVNTHACIRMTAIDAYQRDLPVILARQCIGSYDKDHEAVSLRYMDGKIAELLSNAEITSRLESGFN